MYRNGSDCHHQKKIEVRSIKDRSTEYSFSECYSWKKFLHMFFFHILFVSNYLAPPNQNRIRCRIINAHSLQDETLFVKLVCIRIEILREIAYYPTVCNSTGTDSSLSNCRPMISQTSGSRHHNIRWYRSIRSDFYSGCNYRFSTDSNQHQFIKCQYSSHSRKMIRSPWVS